MMLMVAHLSWPLSLSFIEGKWSDCNGEFRKVFMVIHLSWTHAFSFIGGMWSK